MTIIEADGISVEPLVVDSLTIFASQRYSFILTANATVGNYWIRAIPNHAITLGTDGGTNSAILRYDGAPIEDPSTTDQIAPTNPLNEALLRPLSTIVNPGVPGTHTLGAADISLNLALDFSASDNKFTINGQSFVPPTVPVLLQILSGQQDARDLMPQGMVYPLETGKVVELSIPAGVTMGPVSQNYYNF
jgi:iron transport multicopper oxidase